MRKVLVIILACTLSVSVFAKTYYVSPLGSDTASGTIQTPLTFTAAIAKLAAGDSVIVRGGFYSFSSMQTVSKSGNGTDVIAIVPFEGEQPVFDFRTQPYNSSNQGVKLSGSYVHFKGITIQGAGDNGMQVTGSFNLIENCTFRWNSDSGLQMKTGSNNTVRNCDSYENFDYMTGGTTSPDYGGNADGFADKQYTNAGTNTYIACRAWLNSDDAWDLFEKIGNTTLDSCWCFDNGPANYDMTDHIRFKTDSASWFSKFKNAAGRYVIKNYGNGNGFKLGGNYTASNTLLRHCVAVGNTVKGFDQNNNNGTMTLYNCTGYMNNPDYGFSNTSNGTLIIKNSASLGTLATNRFSAKTVTQSNNSWNSGFASAASDFLSVDKQQLLLPRQANGNLPVITFLHQQSSSQMIDKGVDVGLKFAGTAPDLGAFEYNPLSSVDNVDSKNSKPFVRVLNNRNLAFDINDGIVTIYNNTGTVLQTKQLAGLNENISTKGWIPGLYIIRLSTNSGNDVMQKIILR